MIKSIVWLPVLLLSFSIRAQSITVEFDKNADLTHYKTFAFGEGVIITPKDLRVVPDPTLHKWIRDGITGELTQKGLHQVDSAADLLISYMAGTQVRSDAGDLGPLGLTPGANTSQTYMHDYRQGSLVIDLNDRNNNKLVWRVNAITNTNMPDAERVINQLVSKGFKKFSIQQKKKKKK